MLKSDKGHIVVEGSKLELLAELTQLMRNLVEDEIFSKEDLETCVKISFLSYTELDEELEKHRKEVSKRVIEMLEEILRRSC